MRVKFHFVTAMTIQELKNTSKNEKTVHCKKDSFLVDCLEQMVSRAGNC